MRDTLIRCNQSQQRPNQDDRVRTTTWDATKKSLTENVAIHAGGVKKWK